MIVHWRSNSWTELIDDILLRCRYKTGFLPPPDYVFEDLSKADSVSSTYSSQNNLNSNHLTQKGTLGANKMKKRGGLLGIFSSNKVEYNWHTRGKSWDTRTHSRPIDTYSTPW